MKELQLQLVWHFSKILVGRLSERLFPFAWISNSVISDNFEEQYGFFYHHFHRTFSAAATSYVKSDISFSITLILPLTMTIVFRSERLNPN